MGMRPRRRQAAATNCPSVRPASDCFMGAGFSFPPLRGASLSRIEVPIPSLPADPPPAQPADRDSRTQALVEALEERILVLDGATGTMLQSYALTAADFGGPELEGCNENLCLTRPDVVRGVSERYLAAGADIVETDSFGGTPLVLAEYGLADRAFELNRLSAALAREACAQFEEPGRLRFVAGSIGPTTKAISVTGGITFEELAENFRVQALGLMAGGADYLLVETCQDTRNVKAALVGLEQAFEAAGWRIPVAVSATIEPTGTMLAGQDAEALAVSLAHADLLYVGLNCATGPGPDVGSPAHPLRALPHARRLRPQRRAARRGGEVPRGARGLPRSLRPLPRRRLAQSRRRLLRHDRRRTSRRSPSSRAAAGRGRSRTTSAPSSRGSRRSSWCPRTGRCWSASAPTCSARAASRSSSPAATSRRRPTSAAPRCAPARR